MSHACRTRAVPHNITLHNETEHNETHEASLHKSARAGAHARVDQKCSDWDRSMADLMHQGIVAQNPKAIPKKPAQLTKWAATFRIMREIDKLSESDIERSLNWVFRDDFWSAVVQSPIGLRRNWNKITKKMQSAGGSLSDTFRKIDERAESGNFPDFPF